MRDKDKTKEQRINELVELRRRLAEVEKLETEQKWAEEILQGSERKYRSLFENMLNGFAYCKILVDENNQPVDFVYLEINDAFERLTGLKREEVIGKKVTEAIPGTKESHPELFNIYGKVALSGEPTQFEIYFEPLRIWFTISVYSPERGYFAAVFESVTERKRAEEAVRESEERYRSLVNNVKLGVFRSTPEPTDRFLEVNPAMEKITGYRRKELMQMNVTDLYVHPEEREQVLEEVASGKGKATREVQFKKKDGTEIVVSDTKVVVRDDAGKILHFDGIMEDITERKRAEERITHLTNVLRALRSINQLIAHEKDRGRLIQRGCDILVETRGYRRAWMLLLDEDGNFISAASFGAEEKFPILLEQMKRGEYPPCVREVLAQEQPFAVCDDVKKQHIECMMADCYMGGVGFVSKLEYESRVYGAVCVVVPPEMAVDEEEKKLFWELATDISYALARIEGEEEHRQVEEKLQGSETLKELDRLRSELMANISHELRTPLASIKGFASTLLQLDVKWSEEEQRDFLQSIDQEADRLTHLISNLLDMSCLDTEALKLEKHHYRISEILEGVGDKLTVLTEHHQLEVVVPSGLPPIFVDEMRIGQVLTNLVENAVKFSSKGSQITIESEFSGDQVIISVTDRGQGIALELLDRVFDRFYQAESVVTGRKSGTGLGLSICQGIIKAHGGRIWVESKLDEGSKFSFNLPVNKGEEQVA